MSSPFITFRPVARKAVAVSITTYGYLRPRKQAVRWVFLSLQPQNQSSEHLKHL